MPKSNPKYLAFEIDFLGSQKKPVTEEELQQISEYIKAYKEKRAKAQLKKKANKISVTKK